LGINGQWSAKVLEGFSIVMHRKSSDDDDDKTII